ncbi:MAG: protein translocase subunit SecD, partial [Phycisphaerae bacterium]|nr:protein translocase subunit SecD [Phycisphaerae bacterium]
MKNIVWKLILIVAILGLCLASILGQQLRLGKDLRGGVSLIYQVAIPEDRDAQEILTQTITVLKDRVNPSGVLDISMQPLGRDRIEIVMPLPSAEVQELAREYRTQMSELLARAEISANALDDALQRNAAVEEFGGAGDSLRGEKITALQAAYQTRAEAREVLAQANRDGVTGEGLRLAQAEVAKAEIAFEALYDEVLDLSLGEARVRRVLNLSTDEQTVRDENDQLVLGPDGEPLIGASPRQIALDSLTSEYPHLAEQLARTVAAFDAYQEKRTGFDDPEDLVRLLRGAGVLEYHIAVTPGQEEGVDVQDMRDQLKEKGPENTSAASAKWFPINELKQWYESPDDLVALEADPVGYFASRRGLVADVYEGEYLLLLYTAARKSMTHDQDRAWSITQTYPSVDNLGRPAVAFNLDASGGGLMGRLTGGNIGQPMAIVLDGQVYSAPVIRGQINTNGQISGNFSQQEVDYLIRVLAAGSLQARLSPDPIATNTLGPSIGADNLRRGKDAFIISIIAVAIFMLAYYFFAGLVADLALIANGIIIFGVMMAIDGTFTLPGLAGIVLTIGMAVDANVLIYERIREEIFAGELDLRGCVRQGYRKALSTILDGNITNLIVCFVLFKTATTEVKGFALTLTIGICATLFTALFVTRQIYYLYTDLLKARTLPMLPTVVPAIHRALEPSINWIGLRKIFWTFSAIAVTGSLFLVSTRGVDMFDTEFRGGVALTMLTKPVDADGNGEPDTDANGQTLRRQLRHSGAADSVEQRIRRIGEDALATSTSDTESRVLAELVNASILTAGETTTDAEGNELAESFQIKVASPKGLDDDRTITDIIVNAIVREFGEQLDVTQPLDYTGAGGTDHSQHLFPITKPELGKNIGRPDATQRVPAFLGGAAIVLENVSPPVTPDDVAKRIDRMRNQPDFVQYSARKVEVFGLTPVDRTDPKKGYTELAVLVYDPYRVFDQVDTSAWYTDVADTEWRLVGAALQRPTSLEQVSSFSSAVAKTLAANAVVAVFLTLLGILVYIWVRFGSLRYSLAAIAALV